MRVVLLLACLRGAPAPPLEGDAREVDSFRPRTLVADFIKTARPWNGGIPGVEPDRERLGLFPPSYENCPEVEALAKEWRAAATSDEMIQYLRTSAEEGGAERNPDRLPVPKRVQTYPGRKWRGWDSDIVWAANELRTKGFTALRDVVPLDEVAALRETAEDAFCAIVRALAQRNLSHCVNWKLKGGEDANTFDWGPYRDARECPWSTKFSNEYVVHEPGATGCMEMVYGSEGALVVGAHRRLLKKLWPLLGRMRPDFAIDERGFLRNQNSHGGYWHRDVLESDGATKGTSYTIFLTLQDFNATNGGTVYAPWGEDYVAQPSLTPGSVLIYDSVGLPHRAGNHTPPPGARDTPRWVTWTTLVAKSQRAHLCPYQNGEGSVFDLNM